MLFEAVSSAEGIRFYYVRYDIKSSANTIIDDNLLMVPAKKEFRAENFSFIRTSGAVSAISGNQKYSVDEQIKKHALSSLLVTNGLKSVKTRDYDTVISYEGVFISPLKIIKKNYNSKQNIYEYDVQVEFSPITFPDKWETLKLKHKIKTIFHDFFKLLQ